MNGAYADKFNLILIYLLWCSANKKKMKMWNVYCNFLYFSKCRLELRISWNASLAMCFEWCNNLLIFVRCAYFFFSQRVYFFIWLLSVIFLFFFCFFDLILCILHFLWVIMTHWTFWFESKIFFFWLGRWFVIVVDFGNFSTINH